MFGLCLNCSPEKKAFKAAKKNGKQEVCEYISSIIKGENSINNIQTLFDELSNELVTTIPWNGMSDKDILSDCIAKMDTDDSIFKGLPNNSDLKGKLKIQKQTLDERLREQELREKRLREQEEQQQQQRQQRAPQASDNRSVPQRNNDKIGFHTAIQQQDAGKSRRRHRRGRTLHKRRKSRKVRKTRCRRK